MFEAVAEVCGIELASLTPSLRGSMNKAVAELKRVGASPEDVAERARRYRRQMPKARLTPSALAKHWSMLGEDRANGPDRNISNFAGMRTGQLKDA